LSRHGPSDNKKQFATHWALTTTNDSRTSQQLPPPDFPIFPLFTDFPDPIPYYTIPLILLSLACLVQFCHKWQHMAEWFQVAKDPGSHAIKSFCSVNAFREHRIICDIRSSQWTGQNGCKSKTLDVVCLNPSICQLEIFVLWLLSVGCARLLPFPHISDYWVNCNPPFRQTSDSDCTAVTSKPINNFTLDLINDYIGLKSK